MATFLEQYELARDETFLLRLRQAVVKAALAIANEQATDRLGVDSKRVAFARQVLHDPGKMSQLMAYGVVTRDLGESDAELESVVAMVWNAYAGVNPNIVPVNPEPSPEPVEPSPLADVPYLGKGRGRRPGGPWGYAKRRR